jgi:uncharacterized protein YutE (UPF0331/DUF86 family)
MVDRDKIEGLIRHLQEYNAILKETTNQPEKDYLNDPKMIGSTRYYLQISIETCINIANHMIATQRLRAPKDYKDSFQVLYETKILYDEITRKMKEVAGLRNLLVHIYWDVDDRMIYESIQSELNDFEDFITEIMVFIDKNS